MNQNHDRSFERHVEENWTAFDNQTNGPARVGQGGTVKKTQQQKSVNPWGAGGEWNLTPSGSPTSSRGTRESGGSAGYAEDPFR
jgi:hypothetical protein